MTQRSFVLRFASRPNARQTNGTGRLVMLAIPVLLLCLCAAKQAPGQSTKLAPQPGPELATAPLASNESASGEAPAPAETEALFPVTNAHEKQPAESEITVEGLGSFGHFHLFANSWWSDLYWTGIEYDRHSWGQFLKAQMDYVAEVQPVMVLRQPPLTNVWGIPLTQTRVLVPGVGIMPIGLRMLWRSNQKVKPYVVMKGGILAFTQKALSQEASYENFSLQIGLGTQIRLKDNLDMRIGFSYFHFSDGFIVPSNPGLDSMAYTGGLSYHLHQRNRIR